MRKIGSKHMTLMKRTAAAMVIVLAAAPAAAGQTLRDAVEGAWRLNPELRSLEAKRAEAAGEISLIEFVRAHEAAFEADLARATADIQVGAARARLNQSLGVLP